MQREIQIGSLEEMCDLMCGGIEIDCDDEVAEKENKMTLREFLELFDFDYEIAKNKDGERVIKLIDLQRANLGNIEEEEFCNTLEVIDRLDIYYYDYLYTDICEEYGYEGEEYYPDILEFTKQNNLMHKEYVYYIVNPEELIVEEFEE